MTSRQCLASFADFRQRLREGEMRLETARRQIGLFVELAGIGDPFVDQDQARPVLVHQLAQDVAGAGRLFVVGRDALEGPLAAKLPGEFAPQRAHDGAVGFDAGIARRNLVADQHDALDAGGKLRRLGFLQDGFDAQQFARRGAGEQVIERQHRVGLAAAEIRLQLHDRVAALAGQATHGPRQQLPEALGQIGAAEELGRLAVRGSTGGTLPSDRSGESGRTAAPGGSDSTAGRSSPSGGRAAG